MGKIGLKEISLFLASVMISVFLAEVLVRSLGLRPFETNIGRHEFDSVLGWRTRTSHSTYISRRSFAHHVYYTADGLPCGKHDIERRASRDQPSIALIGDSFVEGAYLPYEKSLASVLQDISTKQVLNFGVAGYGPDQYLLAARRQLPEFNVTDIVVFLFPTNDTPYLNSDTYLGYAKPLISIPEFEPINTPLQEAASNNEDRGLILGVLDHLALWSLVKPLIRFVAQPDIVLFDAPVQNTRDMRTALRLVGQIHTEFPEPTFHVYYIPELSELKNVDVFNHNIELFLKVCYELAINCITPSALSQDEPEKLYIPIDRHFSELGARLVANQIYELLEKQD